MPRVRDHAKEYAALKARAQSAGLSTRGFRRERAQKPEVYYAPRAQVTYQKRARVADVISTGNQIKHKVNPAQANHAASVRVAKSGNDAVEAATGIMESLGAFDDDFDNWEELWDELYEYDDYDLGDMLYYHE